MSIDDKLLEELKKHTLAIKQAMPDLSKEERMKIITKAITDSNDIPVNLKDETIKILSDIA